MKTNVLSFILFFAFFYWKTNAQEFILGKVSIAELEQKEHPKDPSAVAAILFNKGESSVEYFENSGFQVVTKVQTRIKIYKKEGYTWANQEVRYHLDNSFNERVVFRDAVTYNLVDGKIEKTKLKSDGEFIEKINKYWGRKKIAMPNVKEGSVIEFEYYITTGLIGYFRDWYFQTTIPVNFSEFKTKIPEYYTYNSNQKGFIMLNTTVTKKQSQIVLHSKERSGGFSTVAKTTFSEEKIDFIETQTTYSAKDLPAMKKEAYVSNIENYTSSISHELSIVKLPDTPTKYYSTDWESVVKTIYNYDDFGPEIDKTGYFEDDITKLLIGKNAQNERIVAVFNYVKSNIKWNDFVGYSCNDGVKVAYKEKTGNSAEINLMLTAMLRYAGLNANPVLISTRDNGIAFFPSRNAFNYVIAAVETPEGLILLDATEKYAEPNILPIRDLNWVGRLIRKDGTSTEVDLMPKKLSKAVTNISIFLKNDGSVDGKIRRQFTDYEAFQYRDEHLIVSQDAYLEKFERENNNIEISEYLRENDLDLTKPIVENYLFKDTKSVEIINEKIYISPLLFFGTEENPFKQEVREYPIDFGYPTEKKFAINIKIPEGYVVESMPKGISITTDENLGFFKYIIANPEGSVQIGITAAINAAIISADFYIVLKDFYQQMIDKQNEKIVLKKL